MINIEGTNKIHDIYRLLWLLCTYVLFAAIGYLLSYYYHVGQTIQNIINRPVNCLSAPPVVIKCEIPKTGV